MTVKDSCNGEGGATIVELPWGRDEEEIVD